MTVRARVWSTAHRYQVRFRGRIFSGTYSVAWGEKPPTTRTWHYAIYNSQGEVVLYDNTGSYNLMLQAALIRVEALRHMETAGHRLKPYRGDR